MTTDRTPPEDRDEDRTEPDHADERPREEPRDGEPAEPLTADGGVTARGTDPPAPTGEESSESDRASEPDERQHPTIDPAALAPLLRTASAVAGSLSHQVGERTVNVNPDLDETEFFTGVDGEPTVVDRYDLERAVPDDEKRHFREIERYWVNKPYAFVIVFHSERENEKKYYVVEPHLTETEEDLREFLVQKLADSITYSWTNQDDSAAARASVIEEETYDLLSRYDMYSRPGEESVTLSGLLSALQRRLGLGEEASEDQEPDADGTAGTRDELRIHPPAESLGHLDGVSARPESSVLADGETSLTEYQVQKLLYFLRRDLVGFGRIDPIKHDVNVEDISCDGYEAPVFVYHSDHEQLITNIEHGKQGLDDFVVKLAQRSGKGISKRQPQVDATLSDGSRAQLTLGTEVSDRGTNYTIRQFKDVPFTPVDLINWHTFSLDQIALLWLCIENHKSIIFAGGTASGKTTSLNAMSLFIPSTTKIVSIEDTREVELPQRNWIASVTRPSFSEDDAGDVDEFDLLEAALRQRPDYLVMGEVRGEEGRTLFQMMSTGHTTYTTFHADSVGEVIDRFTTDPINVSKSLFTALDLVTIQVETRVQGRKVRRNRALTEINRYDAELDEVNVQDIYQWQPRTDEFKQRVEPNVLQEVKFDRGWDEEQLGRQLFERRVLLAYLVDRGIKSYAEVAAAIQGYINTPETIMGLLAADRLDDALADLRSMESVLIDIDPAKEEMVPRPDPSEDVRARATEVLETAEESLFDEYGEVEFADAVTRLRDAATFDWNAHNAPADPESETESAAEGPPTGTAPPHALDGIESLIEPGDTEEGED